MIDVLKVLFRLKDEERAGWLLRGIERPESVADHSWATALLCLLYGGEGGVDPLRAAAMAVVHDVAESVTGDLPARIGADGQVSHAAGKAERERRAIERLFPAGEERPAEIRSLWLEYEGNATPLARFVRDMNLVEMCLQALIYEGEERYDPGEGAANFPRFRRLEEFFATSEQRIATETGRALFESISAEYRALVGRRLDGKSLSNRDQNPLELL